MFSSVRPLWPVLGPVSFDSGQAQSLLHRLRGLAQLRPVPAIDPILAKSPLIAMEARWGLIPSWFGGDSPKAWKAATFNARIEDAREKPAFRQVWRHGRCLVPVGGFYEWSGPRGARQPHFFSPAGNEANLYLAGLASRWRDLLTCTVLTRKANGSSWNWLATCATSPSIPLRKSIGSVAR